MVRSLYFWAFPILLLSFIEIFPIACGNTPTAPAATPTPVPVITPTYTATACLSCTATWTATATSTSSPTASPTSTFTGTPTSSPTITATPTPTSPIEWYNAYITRSGTSVTGGVNLRVYTTPEAVATVSEISSAGQTYFTYAGNTSLGGNTYASYTASGFTYIPGFIYTLQTVTSAGTAWFQTTAPGEITVNSAGTTATWGWEGNGDFLNVYDNSSNLLFTTYGSIPDLVSPYSIPSGAYTLGSGTYKVLVNCVQSQAAYNAQTVNVPSIQDIQTQTVTR